MPFWFFFIYTDSNKTASTHIISASYEMSVIFLDYPDLLIRFQSIQSDL